MNDMKHNLKIAVIGAEGRMGREVVSQIEITEGLELLMAITNPKSKNIDKKLGGVLLVSDINIALNDCDVVIDFSTPATTLETAKLMLDSDCKVLVTGTTGFSNIQEDELHQISKKIVMVKSGNFSIGVCVLDILVEQASKLLPEDWSFDILDIHHKHKKDAPSGTALMLGRSAEKHNSRKAAYKDIRRGDIIGEHYVNFSSPAEILSLSHKASDRALFAKGALYSALWAYDKPFGMYNMRDVLGYNLRVGD